MHAGGGLIPAPETLTCPGPRVLWIELSAATDDVSWLEAIIRRTNDLESIRFCHDGESEQPDNLLRLMHAAHQSGRNVELISSLTGFPLDQTRDLIDCGLDSLTVTIQTGHFDDLRVRLKALRQMQRTLATEKPEVKFAFEITAANSGGLLPIMRLADELGVEQVTVYPRGGNLHPLVPKLLERIRGEFPAIDVDASTCEDDPDAPLDAHPRLTGRPITGSERVFSCLESPWDSIRLLANGDVVTCAFRRDAVVGNLKLQPMERIWRNQIYSDFRQQYQLGADSECRLCPRKLAHIPGAPRSVVRPDGGNTIEFVEGWHYREGGIVWSKRRSRCLLACGLDAEQKSGADRCIELEGLLPGGTAGTPNELTVWQKGRKLGSFRNSSERIRPFRLVLPFAESSGFAHFEFTTSRVYLPSKSGSPDRRELGFAFVALRSVVPPDPRLPRWRYAPLYVARGLGRLLAPFIHRLGARRRDLPPWRSGITIIIPECGTPGLLRRALSSAVASAGRLGEDTELIVVVNGVSLDSYEEHQREFPMVRWLHSNEALGYGGAVTEGVRRARFDWVYLLNSDMTLADDALLEVARWRLPYVFAVSSQVFLADPERRREETGWTNFSIGKDGAIELFDAVPEDDSTVRGHPYAGGGNSLFRKDLLWRFMSRSQPYNPAYWEDVEWGARAWRAGFEVLFCPASHVMHVHRATVSRLFSPAEVDRIWKRNQTLFSLRNGFTGLPSRMVMRNLRSALDLKTQRELITIRQAASLFKALLVNARAPARNADLARTYRKYYLHPTSRSGLRPAALVVCPFAVYPPGHGGARRIASLVEELSRLFDIVLLTDEESGYRIEHIVSAWGPASIHLTGGRPSASASTGDRISRIHSHSHDRLRTEMERLALVYKVALIQIEHVELAGLIESARRAAACVIDLHDVLLSGGRPTEEDRIEQALIGRHDAVLTCSPEDARLVTHRRVAIVPNGFTRCPAGYRPSRGSRMILFAGPFRYAPNLAGIRAFLKQIYPPLTREVPGVELTILGGTGSRSVAARYPCFDQPGITIIDYSADMEPWLERCALTINPLPETRGSCVKVIESLGFGRVCVSTEAGARGFRELNASSLITVPGVQDFWAPVRGLLLDEDLRTRLEQPDDRVLAELTWENVGRELLHTYQNWFGREWQRRRQWSSTTLRVGPGSERCDADVE